MGLVGSEMCIRDRYTVQPTSALPTIADPTVLDGTTQTGFTGSPIIELDGTSAGAGVNGLTITAGNSTVRGLVINRFTDSGINIFGGNNNIIAGNYIGTDVAGTSAFGNQVTGVFIGGGSSNNVIGGTSVTDRNILSGNGV